MSEIPEDKPKVVRHRRSLRGALADPNGPSFPDEDALRAAIELAWEIELRERYLPVAANQATELPDSEYVGPTDQGSIVSEFQEAASAETP